MTESAAGISQGSFDRSALDRVLAIARRLSASADLREILNLIIDAMRDTLDAERATVFEFDANSNELFTNVAHGIAPQSNSTRPADVDGAAEIRIPATSGLAGECAQT